jgi:hypothetical protein
MNRIGDLIVCANSTPLYLASRRSGGYDGDNFSLGIISWVLFSIIDTINPS